METREFRERVLSLAQKGTVYPKHVEALVSECPDDLFPLLWDLTGGLQLSSEEAEGLREALRQGEEAFVRKLVTRRSRELLSGRLSTEIDHCYAVTLRMLMTYLAVFAERYVFRAQLSLPVAREHLEKIFDLSLGVLEVLLDLSDRLPRERLQQFAERLRLVAEDWSARVGGV